MIQPPSPHPKPRVAPASAGIERRAERLLRRPGSGLESFNSGGFDRGAVAQFIATQLDAAARATGPGDIALESAAPTPASETAAPSSHAVMEAERLVTLAERGIAQIESGVAPGALDDQTAIALEAVISVTDRPSIPVRAGACRFPDPPLPAAIEFWLTVLTTARARIRPVALATGALLFDQGGAVSASQGTVWRLGENLVVTNRHVAAAVLRFDAMAPENDPLLGLRPFPGRTLIADFALEHGAGARRYAIEKLVHTEPADRRDLAVFRLKPWSGEPPPAGVSLAARGTSTTAPVKVFVVGHPARDNLKDAEGVSAVFGQLDGSKRLSPGEVMEGSAADLLLHDCSTVGGSSGSPVVEVVGGQVLGLHYYGRSREHNEAIFLPALPDDHFLYRMPAG
jgi:hypothetical protein